MLRVGLLGDRRSWGLWVRRISHGVPRVRLSRPARAGVPDTDAG